MSTKTDEPLRVLKFWRDLEVFNIPTAPSAKDNTAQTKVSTLRQGNALPWHKAEFKPSEQHAYLHVVYVGVADTEDLARLLLRALLPNEDLSEREVQRLKGRGWLAAFVVNEHGTPLLDSYLAASFAHGIDAFRQTGSLDNINARLDRAREEFAQRCHRLVPIDAEDPSETATTTPADASFGWTELNTEREIVRALLGDTASASALDWRVIVRSSRIRRSKLKDNQEAATDFLNSFYLDDLDRLIDQATRKKPFGAALNRYLGEAIPPGDRIDILTQHTAMADLVSAARMPSTRWPAPSKFPLFLAQQAAVAHVLQTLGRSDGLIGINGPPGTGKTTLLCDVIAEAITERARRVATLKGPTDLFDERTTVAGKSFFPLKMSVVDGTSIVVTSNNNNAVKNITQELPAREKISSEFGAATYFDDVIREVFRKQKVLDNDKQVDTWGVIAAALGNVSNRRTFAAGFFRDEYVPRASADTAPTDVSTETGAEARDAGDGMQTATHSESNRPLPSMKQVLEEASNEYQRYRDEWHKAKQDFLDLQAEFERQRAILIRAEKAARELDRSQSQLEDLDARLSALVQTISELDEALARQREQQSDQRALVQAHQATLAAQMAAHLPTLWDRLMALFGHETPHMKARRWAIEAPSQQLAEATSTLADLSKATAQASVNLAREREQHKVLTTERAALGRRRDADQKALNAGYATGAKHFPNQAFWAQSSEVRHRASIAVGEPLDQLRARLFLAAIELHRLTILANAGRFIGNLRLVNGMLTNGLQDKLTPDQRPLLWNAFFFVVPVVSTTLASFDRLFVGMEQNSLGWLLIDEAGQATPQSAAGAIWRSRRAVVVGDPLQIEPVFTVPLRLTDTLRRRHDATPAWSPVDQSVQTLADRITLYGSWVRTADDGDDDSTSRLWTGMPLRTHLRCDDPMFSVANKIAYAGQMVQGRVDEHGHPKPIAFSSALGDSAWFNVPSTTDQHPVSEDELALLHDLLGSLEREPAMTLPNKQARIYVISPFRKIGDACRTRVRKAKFEGIECGTVHIFQGKQADIVFLVLGTAPGQQGAGARTWAASKPNLLNVAITRAKCRLYVIGDVQQWGELDQFRELRRALPVRHIDLQMNRYRTPKT